MDNEHGDTNGLEHLPIGEVLRRAEDGDAQALAALRDFEAGTRAFLDEMNAQSAAAVAGFQEVFARSAASTRAAIEAALGPRATGWRPMAMAMPSVPAVGIPKSATAPLRALELSGKRMWRAVDKILGRPRHRKFVSHIPLRRIV